MKRAVAGGPGVLLLVAVLLVAFNLRGAIAAVSPVLPEIRTDLGMSGTVAGLLTTLPVLCFAVLAPVAAWLGQRLGTDRAILLACLVIALGTVGRVLGGSWTLLIGTVVVGAAMTVGNVLVPVVAKRDFGGHAGRITGLFTAALCAGAATTAALTAPISSASSWRIGLAGWALLAIVAAIVWRIAMVRRNTVTASASAAGATGLAGPADPTGRGVWRSPLAWSVALFLGAQGAAYYAVTAWLPTLLIRQIDTDLETAGLAAAVFQILGIAGTLLAAGLVSFRRRQGWLAGLVAGGWAVLLAGLLWWPAAWLLWTVIGGVAQGAGIALALTLVVLRSHDAAVARGLSAMAQFVGYSIGAAGPLVVGILYEQTGSWTAPLVLLLGLAGCMALTGGIAGRDATVGAPVPRQN
ncbi:MAG TPA: MFS transporter [Jiangellaceae bacterium]|nr:MFS transporter [Jiangellaceae bacterium]